MQSIGPALVYLLVDPDGEDIPVPQRLLAEHEPVVELLDWLVSPGGSVRVGEADQLSAPRVQLRRHVQGGRPEITTLWFCDSNVTLARCASCRKSRWILSAGKRSLYFSKFNEQKLFKNVSYL